MELIRFYFNKKIASVKEEQLALAIFDNIIYTNAAQMILSEYKNSIESIKD